MTYVVFTTDAVEDLRRLGPDAVPKVLKKVLLLEVNPEVGYSLGGELTGYRKLVVGRNTWRIVYRISPNKTVEVCEIWAVGARADAEVYTEASRRVRSAETTRPEFEVLARVLDQLGRLAPDTPAAQPSPREPVPQWLADRLIHTVGKTRVEVAALDLQQAVDIWTDYCARPREDP